MKTKTDQVSDGEAERRATAALRVALSTPYKPQSDMKVGRKRGIKPAGAKKKPSLKKR
jgi:hypothetical protein